MEEQKTELLKHLGLWHESNWAKDKIVKCMTHSQMLCCSWFASFHLDCEHKVKKKNSFRKEMLILVKQILADMGQMGLDLSPNEVVPEFNANLRKLGRSVSRLEDKLDEFA